LRHGVEPATSKKAATGGHQGAAAQTKILPHFFPSPSARRRDEENSKRGGACKKKKESRVRASRFKKDPEVRLTHLLQQDPYRTSLPPQRKIPLRQTCREKQKKGNKVNGKIKQGRERRRKIPRPIRKEDHSPPSLRKSLLKSPHQKSTYN
jgi:hypothetical protein